MLNTAAALGRAILTLHRSGATGLLTVVAGPKRAWIALREGTLVAVRLSHPDPDCAALGDLLSHHGAIDQAEHSRALDRGAPAGPVGAWLIEHGAASRPAIEHALRRQLAERLIAVLRLGPLEYRFDRQGDLDQAGAALMEPASTPDVILASFRKMVADVPKDELRRILVRGPLSVTRTGMAVLENATLYPEEVAIRSLLGVLEEPEAILDAVGHRPRAFQALYAWRLLAIVAPPSRQPGGYGLLLRKQQQLRRSAEPNELLGLRGRPARKEARRALRSLARSIHPDRFGATEPEGVRKAAREVMSALLDAERTVLTD